MVWLVQSTHLSPKGPKSSFETKWHTLPCHNTALCFDTQTFVRIFRFVILRFLKLSLRTFLVKIIQIKKNYFTNLPTIPLDFPEIARGFPFPSLFSPTISGEKSYVVFFRVVGWATWIKPNCGAEVPGLRSGAQCHQRMSNRCPRPSWRSLRGKHPQSTPMNETSPIGKLLGFFFQEWETPSICKNISPSQRNDISNHFKKEIWWNLPKINV